MIAVTKGAKKASAGVTDAALAASYRVDVRTIRRWRLEGAPLGQTLAMSNWLSSRKNLPPRLTVAPEKANHSALKRLRSNKATDATGQGAAPALERLETSEKEAYLAFQKALKTNDALEIRSAREGWLRISESLRKYDLLVSDSRRKLGEFVPRAEMERALQNLGGLLQFALLTDGQTDIDQVRLKLQSVFMTFVHNGEKDPIAYRFPTWACEALFNHLARQSGRTGSDLHTDYKVISRVIQFIEKENIYSDGALARLKTQIEEIRTAAVCGTQ